MPVVRCSVCLGMTEMPEGLALANCSFCGSQIVAPLPSNERPDAEQHEAAFDRGSHFHRIGEFDKALAVFERIIQEDETNARAHWACALSRFGIEFVKSPTSGEYIPTCHRASFDSFLEDVDYLAAVKYANETDRLLYQQQAARIADVLRGILVTSQTEKPFDVFICYKEKGFDGQRTLDSQLAQDIYYQLTDRGMNVFFSRITLEDKGGAQYEPYIFAALNSAKVMLVIGTKPEHLNAVWVRNEWSRYLTLMKRDRSRLLIPCYRGMSPYDMPEQLSVLQAYDMGKIGFIQDLVHGIRKVVADKEEESDSEDEPAAPSVESLLRRVTLFLEDGDWHSANTYCEKVLDIDPECARAYLGKLMAALKVHKQEELHNQPQAFASNPNYKKVLRFADKQLAGELQEANSAAAERHRLAQLEAAYQKAAQALAEAGMQSEYTAAQQLFEELGGYRDAAAQAALCSQKAEEARKDAIYNEALTTLQQSSDCGRLEQAITRFQEIPGWRDSEEKIAACHRRIEKIREEEKRALEQRHAEEERLREQRRAEEELERARQKSKEEADRLAVKRYKRKKLIGALLKVAAVVIPIAALIIWLFVIIPNNRYNDAMALKTSGQYEDAIEAFYDMEEYKDSMEQVAACFNDWYNHALSLKNQGRYEEAIENFDMVNVNSDWIYDIPYKDCDAQIQECHYLLAEQFQRTGKTAYAAIHFGKAGNYRDAYSRSKSLWDQVAVRDVIATGSYHSIGLKANGSVVATGRGGYSEDQISSMTNIVSIAAGEDHSVALLANGTVIATGDNRYGQCAVSDWSGIVAIAAGQYSTIGLRVDGTVISTDADDDFSDWDNIIAIAAGSYKTIGLRADGTVIASHDQEDVEDLTDIVAIAAARWHYVCLRADGTVIIPGSSNSDVSSWRNIVAVAAAESITIGLRSDGIVVATGNNDFGNLEVSDWRGIVAIAAGNHMTLGLCTDGTVVSAGTNYYGEGSVSDWRLKTISRPTLPR